MPSSKNGEQRQPTNSSREDQVSECVETYPVFCTANIAPRYEHYYYLGLSRYFLFCIKLLTFCVLSESLLPFSSFLILPYRSLTSLLMKPTRVASLWFPIATSAHLPAFSKLPTWTRLPMAPASLCEPLSPFSRQEDDEIFPYLGKGAQTSELC
jgi:hypothetical protein